MFLMSRMVNSRMASFHSFCLPSRKAGVDNDIFPRYEGDCRRSDLWGEVDDIGRYEDYTGKLELDMIRKHDWANTTFAFGCPENKLEELRN